MDFKRTMETEKKIKKCINCQNNFILHKNNHYGKFCNIKCNHYYNRYNQKNKCLNCGEFITNKSDRCYSCSKKGKLNPSFGNSSWNNGKHILTNTGKTHFKKGMINITKGKDYEKIYGKERANEIKKKLIQSHKGQIAWNKGKILPKNKYPNIGLRKIRRDIIFPIKDTNRENKIQHFLKGLGIEFFTHQYIKEIEHGYQCDILIPSMNLVIECDGDYWHKYPIGREIDHIRTKELIERGFKVLRIWEREIKKMDLNKFRDIINDK